MGRYRFLKGSFFLFPESPGNFHKLSLKFEVMTIATDVMRIAMS